MFLLAKDQPPAWSTQSFVGGSRHVVSMWDWRRVEARGNRSSNVSYVRKHPGADAAGNLTNTFEVDGAWIGGGATDQQFRAMLLSDFLQLVVVDLFSFFGDTIISDFVTQAGKVHRMTVS